MPRFPAQCLQSRDVREDVASVAEAVLAGHRPRLGRSVLAHHDVREFPGGYRPAAADIEHSPHGAVVRQYEHIRIDDIVDVDVITDRRTVLVEDGSPA